MVNRRKRKHSHTVTATGHNGLDVIGHWEGRISRKEVTIIREYFLALSQKIKTISSCVTLEPL